MTTSVLKVLWSAALLLNLLGSPCNSGVVLDYTALMKKYYLLCGADYFCFESHKTYKWHILPTFSYRHLNICPECSCDRECIRRGNCCPDLFFSFPELQCVNRTIIQGKQDDERNLHYSDLMVTSCPAVADSDLRYKCQNYTQLTERLQFFPVTDPETMLTYYNRYCAECHGVTNHTQWSLDIECDKPADFNYLSTVGSVVTLALERQCLLQAYDSDNERMQYEGGNCFDFSENKTLFMKCNETGNWRNFDPNIKYACESFFKGKFRIFKNMFCYMCNPSQIEHMADVVISQCNMTGQWKAYDNGLKSACEELPRSHATFPHKNIFCYLCNRGNDSTQTFVDAMATLTEEVTDNEFYHFQYDLAVRNFNLEYFKYAIEKDITKNRSLAEEVHIPFSETTVTLANDSVIDIKNLINQYISLNGRGINLCMSRRLMLPPGFDRDCLCHPRCVFGHLPHCCADLRLELETSCRDELELSTAPDVRSNKKGFLTINGCFQEKFYRIYKDRCSTRKSVSDIFSILPINELGGNTTYDSFYCLLCNLQISEYAEKLNNRIFFESPNFSKPVYEENVFKPIKEFANLGNSYAIWNLEVVCPVYLDFSHHLVTGEILKQARKKKCRVRFDTPLNKSVLCDEREIRSCQNISAWTYSDSDVEWACNNNLNYPEYISLSLDTDRLDGFDTSPAKIYRTRPSVGYTNSFCALCKPSMNFTTNFIDSCNVTGHWDKFDITTEFLCENTPRIYYYYPFKNIFCVLCNGLPLRSVAGVEIPSVIPSYGRVAGITWFPVLRNLFSLSQNNPTSVSTSSSAARHCTIDQVYDYITSTCKNLTCFSGKYLQGSNCQPLFQITKNLRYRLHLVARVVNGVSNLMADVVITTLNTLKENIMSSLRFVIFTKIIGHGYGNACKVNVSDSEEISLDIDIDLFIPTSVMRLDLEMLLTDFHDSTINITKHLKSIEFLNETERLALSRNPKNEACLMAQPLFFPPIFDGYYLAKVSHALICRQVTFNVDEYNMTVDHAKLTLIRNNLEVDENQFDVTPEGEVRVCYDFLESNGYFGKSEFERHIELDARLSYLWILSMVCTLISLVCLLIGFLIYCMFPILRTIPGKLIMIMMSSLFFTLIFLSLSYFLVDNNAGCITVGIALHFSWLSVFTSMQACNFHMFKVFTSKRPRAKPSDKFFEKTIVLNTCYIFGTPLLIVIANVALSQLLSHGLNLGYGGSKCFMDSTASVIIAFIVPLIIICISNVIFFIFTIRTIHRTPNPESNQRSRDEVAIFVRLTSITGISWLLQVVDSFLPLTAYSFVVTAINSLQGLFIFLAFVVNRRNIALVKAVFDKNAKKTYKYSSTSPSTSHGPSSLSQNTRSTKL